MTDRAKRRTRGDYQAGALGDAAVERREGGVTLVFTRELRHPPERVWRALTDPKELAQWAPFDPSRNLAATGPATLHLAGGPEPEAHASTVLRAEPHVLLEYTWQEDLLLWELEPTDAGTRLTLRHTLSDPAWLSKVTAGWHICLDVAERALDGKPIGRIVGDAARKVGWERLDAGYRARFDERP